MNFCCHFQLYLVVKLSFVLLIRLSVSAEPLAVIACSCICYNQSRCHHHTFPSSTVCQAVSSLLRVHQNLGSNYNLLYLCNRQRLALFQQAMTANNWLWCNFNFCHILFFNCHFLINKLLKK